MNDACLIPLTRGYYAIVDLDDYHELRKYKWHASKSRSKFYASRSVKGKLIRMHNMILEPPPGMLVDHINRDSLDNRRSNLRICTRSENVINSDAKKTSKYLGVHYAKKEKMWVATIRIGRYTTEVDAKEAFDRARQLIT